MFSGYFRNMSQRAFAGSKGFLNRGAMNRAAAMAGVGSAMAGIGSTTGFLGNLATGAYGRTAAGAFYGSAAGGLYGGLSDNTSVLGGMAGGAAVGAAAGIGARIWHYGGLGMMKGDILGTGVKATQMMRRGGIAANRAARGTSLAGPVGGAVLRTNRFARRLGSTLKGWSG